MIEAVQAAMGADEILTQTVADAYGIEDAARLKVILAMRRT